MTPNPIRRAFTITIMTHPRPITVTCSYFEATTQARSLSAISGQPVYLSWQDDDGRREERITASSPAQVRA